MHNHNGVDYPSYQPPAKPDLAVMMTAFRAILKKFCTRRKLEYSKFFVDERKCFRAFIRADQRRLHYKMYHHGMLINEPKKVAVLAYWLMRYKPLVYDGINGITTGMHNEDFVRFLIFAIICEYRKRKGLPKISFKGGILADMRYSFVNRQDSLDGLTLLVDSIAHAVSA